MPAKLAALSADDISTMRAELRAGRRPRVVLRTGSADLPAGARGSVVRLDEETATDEVVVVRIRGDEIPFAPAELALPAGRATGAAAATPVPHPAAKPATAKPATKPAGTRRRMPAPFTVTLRFSDGRWSVEAARGRLLVRPAPVRPGAARAAADLLGVPAVGELVAEAVDACREEVAREAARLREELRVAEAALDDYEPAGRRRGGRLATAG